MSFKGSADIRKFVAEARARCEAASSGFLANMEFAISAPTDLPRALDIIEALSSRLAALSPAPNSGSHWPECWRARGHHECAVREAERLRGEVDAANRRADGERRAVRVGW